MSHEKKEEVVDFLSLAKQLENIGANVASLKTDINSVKEDVKCLQGLKSDLAEMKESNKKLSNNLTQSIRDNVGKIKTELLAKIDEVKENFQIDINGVQTELGAMNLRLVSVESKVSERKPYATDFTAVITGEPYRSDENPADIAKNIIENGLGIAGIEVIRAKRWGAKPDLGRNGIIKVEFATEAQRDRICESSKLLNDQDEFKHNYINKARTGAQLVQYRNAWKIIRNTPGMGHMKVNWYGEFYEPSYRGTGRGRGGSRGRGGRGGGRGRGGPDSTFGGSAGTSNGAGRGNGRDGATGSSLSGANFDGSVFSRPTPDMTSMKDFPNLGGNKDLSEGQDP